MVFLIKFVKKTKYTIKNALVLIIYLLINGLFVLKYGSRQNFISHYFLLFIYVSVVCFGLFLLSKKEKFINNIKKFNYYFLGLSFLIFIGFVLVNLSVDGFSLSIDRWSAIEVGIKSVLNLEYPYNKLDHLGKTTSNLPALFYIGFPFYFLGDIGLLQPFVFVGLISTIYKLQFSNIKKVLIFFLFLMSPSYLWEVFSKSDLMSNIILLLLFFMIWDHLFVKNYFRKPYLLAFFVAFFMLTRAVVIIPITIFIFSSFIKTAVHNKIKFVFGFLVFLLLISSPVLFTITDLEMVKEYNPFIHQTRVGSKKLQLFFIFIAFVASLFVSSIKETFYFSFLILSALLVTILLVFLYDFGFNNAVINSYFDISYLGMIIPFAIFSFIYSFGNEEVVF